MGARSDTPGPQKTRRAESMWDLPRAKLPKFSCGGIPLLSRAPLGLRPDVPRTAIPQQRRPRTRVDREDTDFFGCGI